MMLSSRDAERTAKFLRMCDTLDTKTPSLDLTGATEHIQLSCCVYCTSMCVTSHSAQRIRWHDKFFLNFFFLSSFIIISSYGWLYRAIYNMYLTGRWCRKTNVCASNSTGQCVQIEKSVWYIPYDPRQATELAAGHHFSLPSGPASVCIEWSATQSRT